MVCNKILGEVFPGTQLTFSWFSGFGSSISFAECTFWGDPPFNWSAASMPFLCEESASEERQPKCTAMAVTCRRSSPAREKPAEHTTKKYHYSVLVASSNHFESCFWGMDRACTRNERRKHRFHRWLQGDFFSFC